MDNDSEQFGDYRVTYRMPGDPIGAAGVDGPRGTVVEANSIADAARRVIAEVDGAEVITTKLIKPKNRDDEGHRGPRTKMMKALKAAQQRGRKLVPDRTLIGKRRPPILPPFPNPEPKPDDIRPPNMGFTGSSKETGATSTMERSPVKHVTYGNDLYSLIVITDQGRTLWLVTHTDMAYGASHFAKQLAQGTANDEADGWAKAEAFLKKHRPDKSTS